MALSHGSRLTSRVIISTELAAYDAASAGRISWRQYREVCMEVIHPPLSEGTDMSVAYIVAGAMVIAAFAILLTLFVAMIADLFN